MATTALTPVSGPPQMRLGATRLDPQQAMPAIGNSDPHTPAAVISRPTRWFAHDRVIRREASLVEQENRSVGSVLLLVDGIGHIADRP